MSQQPELIKLHCSIVCPSGRQYTRGEIEYKDIAEEDKDFVMKRQVTVLNWKRVRTIENKPIIEE